MMQKRRNRRLCRHHPREKEALYWKKKENEKEVRKKTEHYECPDVHKNCEYDGAVVLDGVAVGPTKSISDCCEK